MSRSRGSSRLSYHRHAALAGVELLIADPSTEGWQMFHERYLISSFPSVASAWVYRRKSHFTHDGATSFMEPGEIHRVVSKLKPSHFYGLFVEREHFIKLAEESGVTGIPHFRVAEAQSPELLEKLKRFSMSLRAGGEAVELQSHFAVLMHQALRYAERQPPKLKFSGPGLKRSLQRAREILEQRVNEPVSLEELASAAALSRFHLVRHFKLEYGLPPHAYQIHLRIDRACRLLRTGMPCAEVASSAGFADQSHFGRHFKRMMGVTPSSYSNSLG